MKNFLSIVFLSLVFFGTLSAQDIAMLDHSKEEQVERAVAEKTPAFIPLKSVAPTFEGGHVAMTVFMEKNLQYPSMGRKVGREGIVVVECTIAIDGSIQSPKIIKSLGLGFDEEVLRLVHLMPNWQAAQHGMHKVAAKVKIPVSFSLR